MPDPPSTPPIASSNSSGAATSIDDESKKQIKAIMDGLDAALIKDNWFAWTGGKPSSD